MKKLIYLMILFSGLLASCGNDETSEAVMTDDEKIQGSWKISPEMGDLFSGMNVKENKMILEFRETEEIDVSVFELLATNSNKWIRLRKDEGRENSRMIKYRYELSDKSLKLFRKDNTVKMHFVR